VVDLSSERHKLLPTLGFRIRATVNLLLICWGMKMRVGSIDSLGTFMAQIALPIRALVMVDILMCAAS